MSTINETVETALQTAGLGGYARQATPVVQALIEREQRIYTAIVDAGTSAGMSRTNVQRLLTDLGMAAPSLQAVGQMIAQPETDSDFEEMDDDDRTLNLNERVNALEAFARANGYSG